MIVGIDASNVRTGGGMTHLTSLLEVASPDDFGIEHMVVWAGRQTLERLPDRPWLEKVHQPALDRALPHRLLWQWRVLPRLARESCDLLFSPGGNAPRGIDLPLVTMSRNMLPFEWGELFRYGFSLVTLRLLLLRLGQARTFSRATGLIFLTRYAREAVSRVASIGGRVATIPHGVSDRFRMQPRSQRSLDECSEDAPLRLLYVSIIDMYKHQWYVADAVSRLRESGMPLAIDFVGPAYPPALKRFESRLRQLDAKQEFLRYRGPVPHGELRNLMENAEVFVFASSCENMPNILLEAMASGLPIACARRGPMPEVLGESDAYFDPEAPDSIAAAIARLARDEEYRARSASEAFERALEFSWTRCARETLEFLRQVADATGNR